MPVRITALSLFICFYCWGGPPVTSGLQFWFDARLLVLSDGATISAFTDTSGNANDATLSTGTATYHTNQFGGYGAITLSNVTAPFGSTITSTGAHTVFAVFRTNVTGQGFFLGSTLSGFAFWIFTTGPGAGFQGADSQGNHQMGNGTTNPGATSWHQSNAWQTNAGSVPHIGFRMDQSTDATQAGTDTFATLNCQAPTQIGFNTVNNSGHFDGQIQVLGYYNRVLSLSEIQQVEAYLANLSVPTGQMILQ